MTEILTESFCERCGTRYTFESSAPRKTRLGRMRMLSKGVRNFVMSDETSFSEAMAEARSEEELAATAHQLDAFHATFNFCMTCRQYTCGNCWNTADGRCLTCAPIPGQEEPVFQPTFGATAPADLLAGGGRDEPGEPTAFPGIEAWPEADLPAERLARVLDLPVEAPVEALIEAPVEPVTGTPVTSEAPGITAPEQPALETLAESAPSETAAPDAASLAFETAAQPRVHGVAPGQSLDEAIAAYEAMLAEADAEAAVPGPEPSPSAVLAQPEAVEAEPEPVATTPQPEPIAVQPEQPRVAPEPEPEPAALTAAEPAAPAPPVVAPQAPAAHDHVAQPTWPVRPPVAPSAPAPRATPAPTVRPTEPAPAPAANPWLTVAPDERSTPQWPAAPQRPAPAGRHETPLTLAGRPLLPQGDTAALWAASAQEVLGSTPASLAASAPTPAQPCVNCGLSLSANARFCRRCGSRQG